MLLALVAAETAVVAKVLTLRLRLLLPLLLVRGLLTAAIPACALGSAAVAHGGAAVASGSVTLRAAEVSRLSTVLACITVSFRVIKEIASCCVTYLRTAGRKSVFRGNRRGSARCRERRAAKGQSQLVCPCPTARKSQNACDRRLGRGIVTYTALEGSAVHVVAIHLANGHGSVFVGIHLNESKATV